MSTSDLDRSVVEVAHSLGLRPEFPFARLQAWAQANKDAIRVERRKFARFGSYTLAVGFERLVPAAA
jgi:phosphatidylethanolamine/phosphatidyl-N-methylethanolamine N-methyltransferase